MNAISQHPKKLIEVALPLEEINAASVAYKAARVGTIRNLHKWFAAMPLPAWRALLYASLIDDPSDDEKRIYHLDLIKRLVSSGADLPDSDVVDEAKANIVRQFPNGVPIVMDPFCGGGSTLVEAQRLGLPTYGSDLNPVPVLITRTLTELLPRVFGQGPLHPDGDVSAGRSRPASRAEGQDSMFGARRDRPFVGYEGLIRDLTYYAERVRDEAWLSVASMYPTEDGEAPIAWLWARTLTCPNPTCGIETVLTTSWWLSKKKGDLAWISPRVEDGHVHLDVVTAQKVDAAPEPPKVGRGASFLCIGCRQIIEEDEVISRSVAGGLGLRLMAVVGEVEGRRTYRGPSAADFEVLDSIRRPEGIADITLGPVQRYVSPPRFGLYTHADLYTARQLLALTALADQIAQCHGQVIRDGGSKDWADAITSVLGLTLGKVAQNNSSQTRWKTSNASGGATAQSAFGRNDIPMSWDFAETFPFGGAVGSFVETTTDQVRAFKYVALEDPPSGQAVRADARSANPSVPAFIATDPPYFDAIGYADLSDYFYVWHRRALKDVHPDLYSTMAAPKQGELTAMPSHHGNSREEAREYFIDGFTETFGNLQRSLAPDLPLLVVYASKEQQGGSEEETRWSSILTAMVAAGLEITGTWPIHGTSTARMIGQGTNAVASYVVMVSRPRLTTAGTCSLNDFNRALRRELRPAVHSLQSAGVLPVDLAQAAMGPGMQVYSRYREVVDQSGMPVSVELALRLINAALGEVLDEQEGELDPDSRFAVTWWEKHGWEAAAFGEADQLVRPQGISVDDVIRAGVATYPKAGFVSLVGIKDMNRDWLPASDSRPTAWEAVHHLADRLIDGGGVVEAGRLMGQLGLLRDPAQALVYRLHAIAARKGRHKDQERYNALIGSWSDCLAIAATEKDGLF